MPLPSSPTIRVNGHDMEPGADERTDFGMKCRLYRTTSGSHVNHQMSRCKQRFAGLG